MILRNVERYLRESGISASAFGREVARDPRLVHDMRQGRQLGPRLTARVAARIGAVR